MKGPINACGSTSRTDPNANAKAACQAPTRRLTVTIWKLSMIAILQIMLTQTKLRTWAVVMGASVAALICGHNPTAYLCIDVLCGALVLVRPAGLAQKAIGKTFAGMAVVDIGYLCSPQYDGGVLFVWVLTVLGWAQFAILAAWGVYDFGEIAYRRFGHFRRAPALESVEP